MEYVSTRGGAAPVSSTRAVLNGLAPDGGLYVPKRFPDRIDVKALIGKPFREMAEAIYRCFLDDYPDLRSIIDRAYEGKFACEELTPTVKVGDRYVLELFHGPTSAFKDVALSVLPVLMTEAKKLEGEPGEIVILTATSGDTGKAAMEGFRDVPGIRIIVFYPANGVSPIQEKQMVSQPGSNVLAAAVVGNFDDAQTGVKTIFRRVSKEGPAPGVTAQFSSANSINVGRLVPQIVYYFKAYSDLVAEREIAFGDEIDFTVPTGNFGDILAGFYAKKLGLPVRKLVCASNENNVLTDFFETGKYDKNRPFYKTSSPSMDILVSSNLERFLYLAGGENGEKVKALMESLSLSGEYDVDDSVFRLMEEHFDAGFADTVETADCINRVYSRYGYLLDPHTAVAWKVSEDYVRRTGTDVKNVVLSTASPYKFPADVLRAIGEEAPADPFDVMEKLHDATGAAIPRNLAALRDAPIRFRDVVPKESMYDYVMEEVRK